MRQAGRGWGEGYLDAIGGWREIEGMDGEG